MNINLVSRLPTVLNVASFTLLDIIALGACCSVMYCEDEGTWREELLLVLAVLLEASQ